MANAVAIAAAAKEIAVKEALVAAVDATSLEVRKNAAMKAFIAANSAWDGSATANGASSLTLTFTDSAGAAVTFYTQAATATKNTAYDAIVVLIAASDELLRSEGVYKTTAATATGDMTDYSEVNLTGTASVTTDIGITLSAGISVDAGKGYTFGDGNTFDTTAAGRVSLDAVSISGGFGTVTIGSDNIAHLVDADDDGLNFKYTAAGLTLNGAWDSVKDGNQSSYGVEYTADAITVGYNSNEAEEWTASATYALGAGASLVAQTNYTEDAQIGVSFSF